MVSPHFYTLMANRRIIASCGVLCMLGTTSCAADASTTVKAEPVVTTVLHSSSNTNSPELNQGNPVQVPTASSAVKPGSPEAALPAPIAPALALQPNGILVLIAPVVDVIPAPKEALVAEEAPAALAPRMALIPNAPYIAPAYPK